MSGAPFRPRLARELKRLARAEQWDGPAVLGALAAFDRLREGESAEEVARMDGASDAFVAEFAEVIWELWKVEAAILAA